MSRIDRRDMLKVMAATAAGAAATAAGASVTGVQNVFASSPLQATNPGNPFPTPSSPRSPSILSALSAGNQSLNVIGQEFKPLNSTFTYASGASVGSIQNVAGTPSGSYYRAAVTLPNGVIVTQVLFDLIVNDVNAALVYFNGYAPETGGFGPVLVKSVASQSAAIQTIDMGIAPTIIDAVNNAYALYWFPGTNGPTHQLYGARVAWMLNPGLTLFANPRRVWDGFVGLTAPGVYGPVDATLQVASQGGGPSGVPVGAKAAWCAVMSYQAGVMTIFPDLTTEPLIGNWANGVTGPLGIFYMLVPLSPAGKFKFHAFFTGNRFFDVWGYLA